MSPIDTETHCGNIDDNAMGFFKKLIAFNTSNPPGSELAAAQYIAETARLLGADAEVDAFDESRANVLIRVKGSDPSAPSLMLNGHLDVVPATGKWTDDPFVLTERDGRFYGRGTSDMKSGIACMFAAFTRAMLEKIPLRGSLYLLFVADEECDNLGTRHFFEKSVKPDYCIIGEPTCMNLCTAHRGVCRHRVIIEGKSCHASHPENGVNAVEQMARFVLEITKLNREMGMTTHPLLGSSTVAVTTISGGEKHNIIPDRCEAVLDWRTLPGETEQSVRSRLDAILGNLSEGGRRFHYRLEKVIAIDAGNLDPGDRFVKMLQEVLRNLPGKEAEVSAFPATSEQSLYLQAGFKAILCGPGDIAQAHTADEYVEKRQLEEATAFYYDVIRKILG